MIIEDPIDGARILNNDLKTISEWADTWLVKFNPSKSETLLFSRKTNRHNHPPLEMNNEILREVTTHKHLGVVFSSDGSWHEHINYIASKAWQRVYTIRKLKFSLDRFSLQTIYTSFIRPLLEYADVVWDNCTQYEINALEKIQLECARIVTGATKLVSLEKLYREVGWEPLYERRQKHKLYLFYKMRNNLSPTYLSDLVPETFQELTSYSLRNAQNIRSIATRTQLYYKSFLPACIREWNDLSDDLRNSESLTIFKSRLNTDVRKVPKYFNSGNRLLQIYHTRLRTECSALNHHLFSKSIIASSLCFCGDIETTKHYLLECPRYVQLRTTMINNVSTICIPSLSSLLFGDETLDDIANQNIFIAVQRYISETKRFDH